MSIWKSVGRAKFEERVKTLFEVDRYPGDPEPQTRTERPCQRDKIATELLSPQRERLLVDDIAFLASWQQAPPCVSAVTLRPGNEGMGLTLALAANSGIHQEVIATFRSVCRLLEACAQGSLPKEACISELLDCVVQLNRNRIYVRLGVSKANAWNGFPPRMISVRERLNDMVENAEEQGTFAVDTQNSALLEDVRAVVVAIEAVDQPKTANDIDELKDVIRKAFVLTQDGVSLSQRLQACGYPADFSERKELRQIQRLANYFSACRKLAAAARKCPTAFQSVTLDPVDAPGCEIWPAKSKQKHYVHAEVQLLIHHEVHFKESRPRFIGVSKKACYLCACFIQSHGIYELSKVHGELHVEWTVPKRGGLGTEAVQCIRNALRATYEDMYLKLADNSKRIRRAPPVQSAINSEILSTHAGSTSTLRPVHGIMDHSGPGAGIRRLDSESSAHSSSSLTSETTLNTSRDGFLPLDDMSMIETDWLGLYLAPPELQEYHGDDLAKPALVECHLSVLTKAEHQRRSRVICVDEIAIGEELDIPWPVNEAKLSLTLTSSEVNKEEDLELCLVREGR